MNTLHKAFKVMIVILLTGITFRIVAQNDEAGPQLCDPEDPAVIALTEFPVEQIDEQTVSIQYTNSNNQTFEVLIQALNDSDESLKALETYVSEAQLCIEVAPPEEEMSDDPLEIAFGDIFFQTLAEFEGTELDSLVEEVLSREDEQTDYFLQDIISTNTQELVDAALETAGLEIDAAVDENLLSSEDADVVREQVGAMYDDEVKSPIIVDDISQTPSAELDGISVDIRISNVDTDEEILYLVVDPTVLRGQAVWYVSTSADGTTYARVCVSGGSVTATLLNGTTTIWSRLATRTSCADSTFWIQAPSLKVVGQETSNTYTVNTGWRLR